MSNQVDTASTIGEENNEIKKNLLRYWLKVTKALNDDFEEILQFGENSDVRDILNSLFIVEDARLEQIQSDKETIAQLRQENENLQSQIEEQASGKHDNQEFLDLQKQYREVSQLIFELNRNLELKEHRNQQLSEELAAKQSQIRALEIKINELSFSLVSAKEEKLTYMEQAQGQIQQLKEKELELNRIIQIQQLNQIGEAGRKQSRSSNELQDEIKEVTQKPQQASPHLSPTGKVKQVASLSADFIKLNNQKKMELVPGSSQAQYRFGK